MPAKVIFTSSWTVTREAKLEEVVRVGKPPRYRVLISDVGRKPFLQKWFNDLTPASDFIDRLRSGYDPREELVPS